MANKRILVVDDSCLYQRLLSDVINARDGMEVVGVASNGNVALSLMDTLKPGMYSKPMIYTNVRGERSCRIVYMKSQTDPHKANLKEDYSRIQFAALQKKKGERMQNWVKDKAPTYFIKLDPEYKQCPNLENFIEASAKK